MGLPGYIAILGNPTPLDRIRQLLGIDRPLYFQISLEGLAAHKDPRKRIQQRTDKVHSCQPNASTTNRTNFPA